MNTDKKRFSKATLREKLEQRLARLEREHDFDPNNGWNQVRHAGIEKVVDYGRYSMLRDILDDLE